MDKQMVLKIVEISVTVISTAVGAWATLKAAKVSDEQIDSIADRTSDKVIEKLNATFVSTNNQTA